MNLEDFLKPTQEELFNSLRKKYRSKALVHKDNYILVIGEAPIMLLAHLDTVHKKPVKFIYESPDGNILMSPQGIGGDDRCGVYALVKAYKTAPVKPYLLFTCDEEVGGIGADQFATDYNKGKLPLSLNTLKLLVGIDRKGSEDAVYYNCDNPEFEAYITSKGFKTASGSFSDISVIAPKLGIAAVNLSSGYYNAHTLHEYINRKQLEAVIQKVIEITADSVKSNFPKYAYIERTWPVSLNTGHYAWDYYGIYDKYTQKSWTHAQEERIPSDLPSEMAGIYEELLETYSQSELESYRKDFGDQIIYQLYEEENASLYETVNVDDEIYNEWQNFRKENGL